MEQLNVPFRMHGRIAGKALDCVGLTSHAAEVPVPSDYQLRGDFERRILTFMNRHEFALCDGGAAIRPGDILLVKTGPNQLHFMVSAENGLVHAHAGLRRVVLMPRPCPWPILRHWKDRRI